MKRRRLLPIFAACLLVGSTSFLAPVPPVVAADPDVIDGVAALVNKDVITFSQVRDVVAPRERTLRSQFNGQELADKIREARRGALQELIDRQLIIQEFKKKEYAIPQRFVDDRVDAIIREEFGGDRQAFIRTLQAQGYTLTKFREAEKEKIIVQAMRFQNVKSSGIVSPIKIDALYTTNKTEFTTPEQIHLWMIAVNKGTQVTGEGDPQKVVASEIRDKLLKGAKFEQLAQLYSDDSSRSTGGDWGWIDRTTLNQSLTSAAFKLEVNKVSPIVEQGPAYYIMKVSERKAEYTKPLADVRSDLEKKISTDDRERMQEQWVATLRKKALIKFFSRQVPSPERRPATAEGAVRLPRVLVPHAGRRSSGRGRPRRSPRCRVARRSFARRRASPRSWLGRPTRHSRRSRRPRRSGPPWARRRRWAHSGRLLRAAPRGLAA